MENKTVEPKNSSGTSRKSVAIVNAIVGLFLIASIFFSYGIGAYFFSKLFVFASGALAVFDSIPDGTSKRPKLYAFYLFTFIWMFFAVGTENAGQIYGQSYNFTGDVFVPILLSLLIISILWFFVKRK